MTMLLICLFVLILYVPVNNFSVTLGRVFLDLSSTKQRIKCRAQEYNIVLLVRFEPTTPGSRVKHFTTEPPLSSSVVKGLIVYSADSCKRLKYTDIDAVFIYIHRYTL